MIYFRRAGVSLWNIYGPTLCSAGINAHLKSLLIFVRVGIYDASLPFQCFPHEDTPEHKSGCCHINANDFEITTLPIPPEPPSSRPPGGAGGGGGGPSSGGPSSGGGVASSIGGSVLGICGRSRTNSLSRSASQYIRGTMGGGVHNHQATETFSTTRPDIEGLSEKYWGEILERTVSSGNLNAMQKHLPPHLPYAHHLVHQIHQPQQHHQQQTTSFSKASDLQLNLNLSQAATAAELGKFSNSEPKLCEHLFHDVNCAKSKAANGDGESSGKLACGRSIPDI